MFHAPVVGRAVDERPAEIVPAPVPRTEPHEFVAPPPVPEPKARRAKTVNPLVDVDQLELRIEKLVAGGDGLGRHGGMPVFVPRSAPGDLVRVRIVERRPDYGRAEIVDLIEPGPGRRTPRCPHFADCGGCDLQHLDDQLQLRLKVEAALETLRRISRLELPSPRRILAGSPFGYRIRTQLHLVSEGDRVVVGYHARGSRRLVPIRACPVLESPLERFALAIPSRLAPSEPDRPASLPSRLDLASGDGGRISAAPPTPPLEGGELVRRIGGIDYRFDARTFFQGHAQLLDELVEIVVGEHGGATAFDLYGGVGLFALPLARRYERVVLVESERIAVRFAAKNARMAKLENVEMVSQAVETWAGAGLVAGADRVIVDPPRDGLPRELRRLLAARPAARLTYVSCHAAALARDLVELASAYRVESLDFADLFPQTGHLETIVQLVAKEAT